MRVLHVLDHSLPHLSGYAIRTQSILFFQRNTGIEPLALTSPKHGKDIHAEFQGIRYRRTQSGLRVGLPYLDEMMLMVYLFRGIKKEASNFQPQIIHAHSPVLNGWPALMVARSKQIPIIYEIRAFWEDAAVNHGTTTANSLRYRLTRKMETRLATRADRVVTLSETMKKEIVSRGVPSKKVVVVPNAVDVKKFAPRPQCAKIVHELGVEGKTTIGFLGSFYSYEGIDLLVNAFELLCTKFDDLCLVLAGDGFEFEKIKKLAAQSRFSEKIKILGRVPHSEIQDYYSVLDILAFPRRKMRLTELVCPLKPLEAMAMEKAVVGSSVGGIREFIEHERNGLLFEPGNVEDLVQKLETLIVKKDMRKSLGRRARRDVLAKWCWQAVVERYVKIYERVLSPQFVRITQCVESAAK